VKVMPLFAESQYMVLVLEQVTELVPPHLVLSTQQHVAASQVPLVVEPQYIVAALLFNA
jgi:predicted cobalt transporter CbtA